MSIHIYSSFLSILQFETAHSTDSDILADIKTYILCPPLLDDYDMYSVNNCERIYHKIFWNPKPNSMPMPIPYPIPTPTIVGIRSEVQYYPTAAYILHTYFPAYSCLCMFGRTTSFLGRYFSIQTSNLTLCWKVLNRMEQGNWEQQAIPILDIYFVPHLLHRQSEGGKLRLGPYALFNRNENLKLCQ